MPEDREPVDVDARRIIRHRLDETLFVEAGAGAGKTGALVGRITELVTAGGVPIDQIAAVTFTERAAAELRERLRERFEVGRAEAAEHPGLAAVALEDLDLAPIGTLHSFAQRLLSEHPIEAGIPPLIEVLDDVSSSVAFDHRWRQLSREFLDDDELAPVTELMDALGITLNHVRSLIQALNKDWDLVQDRVVTEPPVELTVPDLTGLIARGRALAEADQDCTNPDDKLLPSFAAMREWLDRADALDPNDLLAVVETLQAGTSLKWTYGAKGNWPGYVLADLKQECQTWKSEIDRAKGVIRNAVLRTITQWCGARVLDAAHERRRNGRLEFHDLLVLTRDLLRRNADVRAALQERYTHLLLDEFQDTDPIQIEIALRIAGGAEAAADNWEDIAVPPGSVLIVGDPKQSIYRFRRADIAMYLRAQQAIGSDVRLSTNFRTGEPIVAWVNEVFSELIQRTADQQPAYQPLDAARSGPTVGPAVTMLGVREHGDDPNAAELRSRESADVAAAIQTALRDGWTTQTSDGDWRPLRPGDITVLIPSRTSLQSLEDALDAAGVNYRTESSSLAYAGAEIRALLAACRALADTSDQFSLLTALRSALFGISDLQLWEWTDARGQIQLHADAPSGLEDHPVARALTYLSALRNASRWLSPSEVLGRLVIERMTFEAAVSSPRRREVWRRLRFVIDQARAWSESEHGGLRAYTEWAAAQSADTARVSESILPETDVDSVRIMTIHAAKGLEFPMVVLSGMTTQQKSRTGVSVLWREGGYAVSFGGDLASADFDAVAPIDDQMSDLERRRLLYVAATRARDHLVVSLHRTTKRLDTSARLLADLGQAASAASAEELVPSAVATSPTVARTASSPPPEYADWHEQLQASLAASRLPSSASASGLEGTDPDAIGSQTPAADAGRAKGVRDPQQSAWTKGRYGSAIGRAVHGVLQSVDLASPYDLDAVVDAQCVAEGVTAFRELVRALVDSVLASPTVQRAAAREHWRESYVAMELPDGTIREGIVDLLYREDDGSLVIVDYKTDDVGDSGLAARVDFYRGQVRAYEEMTRTATGLPVQEPRLIFAKESSEAVDVIVDR